MTSNESTPSASQTPEKETALLSDINDVAVSLNIRINIKAYIKLLSEFHRLLNRTQPRLNDRQTHEFLVSIKDEFMENSVPVVQIREHTIGEVSRSVLRGISEVTGIILNPSKAMKAYKKGEPIFQREIPENNTLNLEKLYTEYLHRIDPNKEFLPPLPKELQTVGTLVKIVTSDNATQVMKIAEPIDYNQGLHFTNQDGSAFHWQGRVSGWRKNSEGNYTIYLLSDPDTNRVTQWIQNAKEIQLTIVASPHT